MSIVQEKQLSAWGYAFAGLGYLAIIEAIYMAYKGYGKDQVGTLHFDECVYPTGKQSLSHASPLDPAVRGPDRGH